jgi:hypothetical protein
MKRITILVPVLFVSMFTWQCTKQSGYDDGTNPDKLRQSGGSGQGLKTSVNSAASDLNTTLTNISQTEGYKLLNIGSSGSARNEMTASSGYKDSITLAAISGVYSYKPVTYANWCYSCYSKLFSKTGTANDLIIQLPSSKVFYPQRFQRISPDDTSLQNNFVITATAFNLYYSNHFLYNYNLAASIAVSDTSLGSFGIQSASTSYSDYSYSSGYNFANGDNISVSVTSGDTSSSSVSLSNSSSTLLKETVLDIISSGSKYFERQYILQIGNVEFTRTAGSDSITVYVGGVLQTSAKVTVIDNSSAGGFGFNSLIVGRNRDLQITYDDGTTTKLSTLLGPSLTVLQSLVNSMQSFYFANNLVDYIAESIYFNK